MKKIIAFIVILTLLFTLSGNLVMAYEFPRQATEFNLQFYEHGDGTVDLEILTDKTKGVGGMQILIYVEPNAWTIDESGTAGFLGKSIINVQDSEILFVWDSMQDSTLPNKLFRATFHSNQKNYNVATIQVSVIEYFDDTVDMNDLSYIFTSTLVQGKAKPLYNIWLIILYMLMLLAGVFALFAVSRKWRYIVVTRARPIVKKICKKIKKTYIKIKKTYKKTAS